MSETTSSTVLYPILISLFLLYKWYKILCVKYLEKNGIGRPSTYASIISKVIEIQYVEIKNVEGVKKQSKQLELDNKFKIKEVIPAVLIIVNFMNISTE